MSLYNLSLNEYVLLTIDLLNTLSLFDESAQSNIIVLYREGDEDSLEFANYYKNKYNLSNNSIVPLPCSSNEILTSYDDFLNEVEIPLLDFFYSQLDAEYNLTTVKYIISGYNVPGGFYDGSDIISTTSRLSRINFSYTKKENNPLFNPSSVSSFSEEDFGQIIIASRIDAPNLEVAKKIVDNGITARKQSIVNGIFYFDKVNKVSYDAWNNDLSIDYFLTSDSTLSASEKQYYQLLNNFEATVLSNLNMNTVKTVAWDNKTNVPIFRLRNDSIVWAFAPDKVGYNYFANTNYSRMFAYNADTKSGYSLRDSDLNLWSYASLYSGYAATAGAMSDPTPEGYLQPEPFFTSLTEGATIGEAFYRACPHANWTVSLFGDPLLKVKFPKSTVVNNVPSEMSIAKDISENIASSVGYTVGRNEYVKNILNILQTNDSISVKKDLFPAANQLYGKLNALLLTDYTDLFYSFLNFVPDLDNKLTASDNKISQIFLDLSSFFDITSSNVNKNGTWYFDHILERMGNHFYRTHFIAEFSLNKDLSNPFLSVDTSVSQNGWFFEKDKDVFVNFPSNGVTSNYSERKVRFIGPNYINRGTIYYARVRQRNDQEEYTDWVYYEKVGNT